MLSVTMTTIAIVLATGAAWAGVRRGKPGTSVPALIPQPRRRPGDQPR